NDAILDVAPLCTDVGRFNRVKRIAARSTPGGQRRSARAVSEPLSGWQPGRVLLGSRPQPRHLYQGDRWGGAPTGYRRCWRAFLVRLSEMVPNRRLHRLSRQRRQRNQEDLDPFPQRNAAEASHVCIGNRSHLGARWAVGRVRGSELRRRARLDFLDCFVWRPTASIDDASTRQLWRYALCCLTRRPPFGRMSVYETAY